MITVKCPNAECPACFQVPDELRGKSVRCKKCRTKFKIGSTNGAFSKEIQPKPPTALAPTVQETDSPFRSSTSMEALPVAAPAGASADAGTEPDAARKRTLLYLGLAAGGVCSCLALSCIVGIAYLWTYWGTRSAETYGGIEVSSTTVKASVVEFFPDSETGFNYRFLSEDEMQVITNIEKLGPDGDIDRDALDKTVQGISTFFKDLQNKHGVAKDKIVIVAGSGAFKRLDPGRLARNQDNLRNRVYKETQRTLEIVDVEKELELQIKSLIPEKEMDRTLLVDLGNSLCRGGGYDTKLQRYTVFNPNVGVKGFQRKAEKDATSLGYKGSKRPEDRKLLVAAAAKSVDAYFRSPLVEEMKKTTEINGRKRIELIGGTPWITATYKNPAGRAKKHTPLTKQDIDSFYAEVRRELAYPPFTVPKGLDEKLTHRLNADYDVMERRISVETLIAGTEMLKVLSEELTFQRREVFFNNNGQKGLILGFMTKMWEQGKK